MNKDLISDSEKIIKALCESTGRCTVCYGYMDINKRENCARCDEYYCECQCKKLTPEEITLELLLAVSQS